MGQGKTYLSKFNLGSYRGAETVNVIFNYTPDSSLEDLSTIDSNEVLLSRNEPFGFNYTISTVEETDTNIFLNRNLSGICKGLTNLQHTDLINKSLVNYHYTTNMHTAFANCYRLIGEPISAKYVNSMYGTYYNDSNLIGTPQVNANVNNLIGTFFMCNNLIGSPKVNKDVTMAISTYYQCDNLTGRPAAEVPAKSIARMYFGCDNLSGSPSNINNAIVTAYSYFGCRNIYGTFYWDTNISPQADIVNARYMFKGRDTTNYLNIYVRKDSCIFNALINYPSSFGAIYGTPGLVWTEQFDGHGYPYYTNAAYKTNIYCDYNIVNISSSPQFLREDLNCSQYSTWSRTYHIDSLEYNSKRNLVIYYNNSNYNGQLSININQFIGFKNAKESSSDILIATLNAAYNIQVYLQPYSVQKLTLEDPLRQKYNLNNHFLLNANVYGGAYNSYWSYYNNYIYNITYNNIYINYANWYVSTNNIPLENLYLTAGNNFINQLYFFNKQINIFNDLCKINLTYATNLYNFTQSLYIADNSILLLDYNLDNALNMSHFFDRIPDRWLMFDIINNGVNKATCPAPFPQETYEFNSARERYYQQLTDFTYNLCNLLSHMDTVPAFNNHYNFKIQPICGINTVDFSYAYANQNIYKNAIVGDNVTNMAWSYYSCYIDDNIVCPANVITMAHAYEYTMANDWIPKCGINIVNMDYAYANYRCRGQYIIPVNINSNVRFCRYSYSQIQYLNLATVKIPANVEHADGLYYNLYRPADNIQSLIFYHNLKSIPYLFYNTDITENDIINITCEDDQLLHLDNAAYAFAYTDLRNNSLRISNISIENGAYMYRGCYYLRNVMNLNSINNMTGMYSNCPYLMLYNNDYHLHTYCVVNCFGGDDIRTLMTYPYYSPEYLTYNNHNINFYFEQPCYRLNDMFDYNNTSSGYYDSFIHQANLNLYFNFPITESFSMERFFGGSYVNTYLYFNLQDEFNSYTSFIYLNNIHKIGAYSSHLSNDNYNKIFAADYPVHCILNNSFHDGRFKNFILYAVYDNSLVNMKDDYYYIARSAYFCLNNNVTGCLVGCNVQSLICPVYQSWSTCRFSFEQSRTNIRKQDCIFFNGCQLLNNITIDVHENVNKLDVTFSLEQIYNYYYGSYSTYYNVQGRLGGGFRNVILHITNQHYLVNGCSIIFNLKLLSFQRDESFSSTYTNVYGAFRDSGMFTDLADAPYTLFLSNCESMRNSGITNLISSIDFPVTFKGNNIQCIQLNDLIMRNSDCLLPICVTNLKLNLTNLKTIALDLNYASMNTDIRFSPIHLATPTVLPYLYTNSRLVNYTNDTSIFESTDYTQIQYFNLSFKGLSTYDFSQFNYNIYNNIIYSFNRDKYYQNIEKINNVQIDTYLLRRYDPKLVAFFNRYNSIEHAIPTNLSFGDYPNNNIYDPIFKCFNNSDIVNFNSSDDYSVYFNTTSYRSSFDSNYRYNYVTNLCNKWNNLPLYGLISTSVNNKTIILPHVLGFYENRLVSGVYKDYFYLNNADFDFMALELFNGETINSSIFGDVTWDRKDNVRRVEQSAYFYDKTYYNSSRNLTIKWTVRGYQ